MQIPSPREKKVWHKQTIKRILANETYTGKLYLQTVDSSGVKNNKYKKDGEKAKRKPKPREGWLLAEVPMIIDDATFKKAQVGEYKAQAAGKVKV